MKTETNITFNNDYLTECIEFAKKQASKKYYTKKKAQKRGSNALKTTKLYESITKRNETF